MKRVFALATILALSATMLMGCAEASAKNDDGKSSRATTTREYGYITSFGALQAQQGVAVVYTVSEGPAKVTLKATAGTCEGYEARLDKSGTLVLGVKGNGSIRGRKGVSATFYVSGPAVKAITAGSASRVDVKGTYSVKGELKMKAASASEIVIGAVSADEVEIDAASASSVRVAQSCTCRDMAIEASSAAEVVIKGLKTSDLEVDAASASSVSMSGTADKVEYEAASSAKIAAKGLKAARGQAKAASCASIDCNVGQLKQQIASYGSVTNKR